MLDVRRLKVLREVAACGSFSAAADSLSFTQSAISQHVAALERETGTKLVERNARGIRMTDAGTALVRHAETILARIDDAEEELAAIAGLRGGRLRLACFQSAGATVVPRAVAEFHKRYPSVELSMIEAEPEPAREALRCGEIDLALVYDFQPLPTLDEGDFELTHLIADPYDVVLPKGHALAKRSSLKLSDLKDEKWIASSLDVGCRQIMQHACREFGFTPAVSFECDECTAAQALVAAGVGVTIFPRLALSTIHPGVTVIPLSRRSQVVRGVWAARLRAGYQSPANEAMTQILVDVADEFRSGATLEAVV